MTAAPVIRGLDAAIEQLGEKAVLQAVVGEDWRAGDLSYRLSLLQRRVRALCYGEGPRRVGWLASRRAGKSRTGTTTAAEKAYHYPGLYVPYAAPTGEQVRTFIDPHFRAISAEAPEELALERNRGRWITPPLQWYDAAGNPVPTKAAGGVELDRYRGDRREEKRRQSLINPRGCEDQRRADALRGPGTVFAIVDEARDVSILDYVLTDVLGPMLWEARAVWGEEATPKLLVITTAPREPDHAFVAVWAGIQAEEAGIHSTIYDADHLDARDIREAIKEAGGEDSLSWRREGLAKIERDPRRAMFPEFDPEKHVASFEPPEWYLPTVVGDGGGVDLSWFGFGYWNFELARLEIVDEIARRRTRSDELGALIAAKEAEVFGGREVERRRVDAVHQVLLDMNRPEWGHPDDWEPVPGKEPPHWRMVTKQRGRGGKGSFASGVNQLRVLLKRGQVLIHPRCATLIAHMQGARWASRRDRPVWVKDDRGEVLHHYDAATGLVYFARDVNRRDNPAPSAPRPGLPTHLPRQERPEHPLAAALGTRKARQRRRG